MQLWKAIVFLVGESSKCTASKISAIEMLKKKYDKKAELKEKEIELRRIELQLKKRKMENEEEERKKRVELELEERRAMLELLRKHL